MMERSADPSLQSDIDEWILDYLVFSGVKAVLEEFKGSKGGPGDAYNQQDRSRVCIQLVDCKYR